MAPDPGNDSAVLPDRPHDPLADAPLFAVGYFCGISEYRGSGAQRGVNVKVSRIREQLLSKEKMTKGLWFCF